MREEVLRMIKVTYQEQGSTMLDDFNLSVFAGEIMGIIPLNDGHGLTSFVELLKRNLPLQAGNIYYRETMLNNWRTASPGYNKIGVIQRQSSLMEGLTVADNIFVLRPGFKSWIVRTRILNQQLRPILNALKIGVSPDDYVENLSNFQRAVVELVKAVVAGCHLIILRDVGTFVSDMELSRMHDIIRYYAEKGISFLYLGFHYEELTQICGRIAFFSNGRIVKIMEHGTITTPMVNYYREMVKRQLRQKSKANAEAPAVSVKELCGGAVEQLSFEVSSGECIVLQDLQNRIFEDLVSLFLGEKAIESGEILIGGEHFAPALSRKVAIIKERPDISMIFPKMSYMDNIGITIDHRLPELWRSKRVQAGLRQECEKSVGSDVFDMKPESLSKSQKYDLVYERVLLQNPKVVLCIQPFAGADLEMRIHIWKLMEKLLDKGIALIILAVNLADSLSLASTLIRIRQGESPEVYKKSEFGSIPFNAPWIDLYRE